MSKVIRHVDPVDKDDTVYRVSMQPAPGKPRFSAARGLVITLPIGVLCWVAIVWAIYAAGAP